MLVWSESEELIIKQAQGKDYKTVLKEIPEEDKKWKCHTCFTILKNVDLLDKKCPICGEEYLQQMCPLDTVNSCAHDISSDIANCPICGDSVCPQCGKNHSVVAISRVTGYLSATVGWNRAKLQELKDRRRYIVA